MLSKLVFLGLFLCGVNTEKFTCPSNEPFCFWTSAATNWRSAYEDCISSGGSLVSFEQSVYLEEWMSTINKTKVWSSLRRINHHFQWDHYRREYQPVVASEWIPGHPLLKWTAKKRDCVVVNHRNHRMLYESVDCDDSFDIICAISLNRKRTELFNLALPQAALALNLTLEPQEFQSKMGSKNHLSFDRNDDRLKLKCNISYSGSRKLEISWLKDGVYLENNSSVLVLARVNDKSKTFSGAGIDNIFSKQGTYRCEVREFGALNASISNSVTLTYDRVFTGIVSLWTSGFNASFDNRIVMENISGYIQQVLREYFKFDGVKGTWDPIFSIPTEDALEIRNSVYIDIDKNYPDGTLFHLLDVISDKVSGNTQLHANSGFRKIRISWTTYCRGESETISRSSTENVETKWPSSWSFSTIYPVQGRLLCIQKNNLANLISRSCLPDTLHGASLTTLDLNTCDRLVEQPNYVCRDGYLWMEKLQLCFKITGKGSWNETMAACVSDWPVREMTAVDYETHLSVLNHLQTQQRFQSEFWLPTRRLSVYGPQLYYSSTVDYGPEVVSLSKTELWTEPLLDEECMFLDIEGSRHVSECSKTSIPAVCVYRPKESEVQETNLCPPPWYGYRIHQGHLVCFSVIKSEEPIEWHQAEQKCRQEKLGTLARISMATYENVEKGKIWEFFISQNQSLEFKSAWIGLQWFESHGKFCWFDLKVNCLFQFFNWVPHTNWTNGRYGVIDQSGFWNVLPSTSRLNQVVCQAEIDLILDQNIVLRHHPGGLVNLNVVGHLYPTHPVVHSFNSSEEIFHFYHQYSNSPLLQVATTGGIVKCFLDGELRYEGMGPFPTFFLLNPTFEKARTLSCEGWIGWPRRFVRTEPFIVLRPHHSTIYLILVDVDIMIEEQLEQEEAVNSNLETLHDISQKLDKALRFHGAIVQVIGHRWWNYQEKSRLLMRIDIESAQTGLNQNYWPDLIQSSLESKNYLGDNNKFTYQVINITSGEYCQQEATSSLFETTINLRSIPIGFSPELSSPCLTVDGNPTVRECLGRANTQAFWDTLKIRTDNASCRDETELLKALMKMTDDVMVRLMDPAVALDELLRLGSQFKVNSLNGLELGQAARLLHESVLRIQQPSIPEFQRASQTIAYMLDFDNQLKVAQSLPGISNNLVDSLEQLAVRVTIPDGGKSVAFRHPKMSTETIIDNNEVIGYGANVDKNSLEVVSVAQIFQNITDLNLFQGIIEKDVSIILPVEEIRKREGLGERNPLRLSFTILPNGNLFDARPVTSLMANGSLKPYFIDSPVILAQVGNFSIVNLNQNARIFFRSRSRHNSSVIPVCVFWDKSYSSSSGWSRFGCQYVGKSDDLYICECNHLTPLALLFPYFDYEESVDLSHHMALSLISLIGCVASMIGLALVLVTFLLFKKWRKSLGNKILFNFSLALFCMTACFLSASQVTFDRRLCKANASGMHYFLLSSFAWMVIEGIYQYYNYIVIIGAQTFKSGFMRKAGPVAWGLPILPVLGILIYDSELYTAKQGFCWMTLEAFYFTVLIPVGTCLFFNILIFIGVLKSVLCVSLRSGIRTSQPVRTRSWYQFRMALCIFFLLGLAWVFGFVSLGDSRMVFAYLFCIFNSLQGFFIFIFYVFRERNARKLWFEFARTGTAHDKLVSNSVKSPYTSRVYPNSH